MSKQFSFKGVKFLLFTLIVYLILFFVDKKGIETSLLHTFTILQQIWPIFIFIIFLTTLINYLLKPKHIIKHFGENSGKKGIMYALIAGIISHGPMYAWYGLLEELRQKGAKDELFIIFLYSRAIKLPMIPFSIAVFGIKFTIIISVYILLFAIIQGKLFSYLWNKL